MVIKSRFRQTQPGSVALGDVKEVSAFSIDASMDEDQDSESRAQDKNHAADNQGQNMAGKPAIIKQIFDDENDE